MHPKDADGMANSVDPDQTASSEAVWSWSALFAETYLSQYIEFVPYFKIGKYEKKNINKNKLIPCPIESFETKGKEITWSELKLSRSTWKYVDKCVLVVTIKWTNLQTVDIKMFQKSKFTDFLSWNHAKYVKTLASTFEVSVYHSLILRSFWTHVPVAHRKAKIAYNFGLSECNRVKGEAACVIFILPPFLVVVILNTPLGETSFT